MRQPIPVGLAVAATLAGCTDGPGSAGAWIFVTVALLLVGGGSFALGTLRERAQARRALRQARTELLGLASVADGVTWQTDAEHRPTRWQAPGRSALRAPADSAWFPPAPGSALAAQLDSHAAFDALRVGPSTAPDAAEPAPTWILRGAPTHDDLGRFSGFIGSARQVDDDDRLQDAAAALAPALAVHTRPLLIAVARDGGWRLTHLNLAAGARWPALDVGARLDASQLGLPADDAAALQAALDAPAHARPPARPAPAGWQWQPFGPLPGDARGLLLAAPGTEGTDGEPAAGSEQAESESFSFTVSHDLRAPIRVVEGFTRIVKEDYGRLLDRVGNDHLDRVLGAAARMNLMIDALLTLARLSSQPLARQPVNLSQLASYVVDDLRRGAPERIADVEIEPGLAAQGDPTLLRLVLENLIGNAWKYSARSPRALISLRGLQHGGRPAFVVRDNGAGFDMRASDRLFGLFQRLHSASEFPGHGVGLASVRRIVRRHGGEIWAEAEPGRGAAFFFTLAT